MIYEKKSFLKPDYTYFDSPPWEYSMEYTAYSQSDEAWELVLRATINIHDYRTSENIHILLIQRGLQKVGVKTGGWNLDLFRF